MFDKSIPHFVTEVEWNTEDISDFTYGDTVLKEGFDFLYIGFFGEGV